MNVKINGRRLLACLLILTPCIRAMEQSSPTAKVPSLKQLAISKVQDLMVTDQEMLDQINSESFTSDLREDIYQDLQQKNFILLNSCLENCSKVLAIDQGWVNCLKIDQSGNFLITGSNNNVAHVWDYSTGDCLYILGNHSDGISAVALDFETRQAFTASYDNKLYFWSLEDKKPKLVHVKEQEYTITDIILDPHNKEIITTLDGAMVCRWNTRKGQMISSCSRYEFDSHGHELSLKIGSLDYSVPVINRAGHEVAKLIGHTAQVTAGKVSSDDNFALTGTENGEVRFWDLKTGICLKHFLIPGEPKPINLLSFSDDNHHGLIISADNTMHLIDLQSNSHWLTYLTVSNDSRIVSAPKIINENCALIKFADQNFAFVNVKTGKFISISGLFLLNDHNGKDYAFLGLENGRVELIGFDTHQTHTIINAHESTILGIDCSLKPSMPWMATACKDSSCKLWDLKHNLNLTELLLIMKLQEYKEKEAVVPYNAEIEKQLASILSKNSQGRQKFLDFFAQQLEQFNLEKLNIS